MICESSKADIGDCQCNLPVFVVMDGLQYLGRSSFIYYQYAVLLVAWAGLVATLVSAHGFSHTQASRILLFVGKVPRKLDTFAHI